MADVIIGNGNLAGKGVYANRDFRKGEVVIEYKLKLLTKRQHQNLPNVERNFVHTHKGKRYLYSVPERYLNHSSNPNTVQDLEDKCDIAIRDIKKGEGITTDSSKDDID